MVRPNQALSDGPSVPVRQVPPQVPTFSVGVITIGSFGRRCSIGGSLPSFTNWARSGGSLNLPGTLPAPVTAWPAGAAVGAAGAGALGAQPTAAASAPTKPVPIPM